jgi:hypothetical protein
MHTGSNYGAVWANMDGATGECIDIIDCMAAAIQMTGSGSPGAVVLCYPGPSQTANTNGNTLRYIAAGDSYGHTDQTIYHAAYKPYEEIEYEDSGQTDNQFEATYFYNNLYYPGGGSQTCASPYLVIKEFATLTDWCYEVDWRNPDGSIKYTQVPCYTPGPSPEAYWQ